MKEWERYSQKKIIHPDTLEEKVAALRRQNKKIATLNGTFDLLHAGHLYILFEASQLADILIVALNSDLSIKANKGPARPIIPLSYRMQLLTAITFVDYVTWFEETDPRTLLAKIKPDVHINGMEYGEDCIEAAIVKQNGGKVHLVKRIPGLATSDIIHKISEMGASCV